MLVALPLSLLLQPSGITTSIPDLYGASPTFVQARPLPQFPDMTGNYQQTVVIPREKAAQDALEAARQAPAVQPVVDTAIAPAYATASPGSPMMNIFTRESGNNPKRWNAEGCVGLGQACPASKLLAVCPNLDYDCEVQFFTSYAVSRYGSWDGAWAFWQKAHWW